MLTAKEVDSTITETDFYRPDALLVIKSKVSEHHQRQVEVLTPTRANYMLDLNDPATEA